MILKINPVMFLYFSHYEQMNQTVNSLIPDLHCYLKAIIKHISMDHIHTAAMCRSDITLRTGSSTLTECD